MITQLRIPDTFRIDPHRFEDQRGSVHELFRYEGIGEATGRSFTPAQATYSVSRRGSLRGIHATPVPPGEAKLVTCVRGAVLDVVVDLRVGSPTFGEFDRTRLDPESGTGIFMAEGIGHAFLALTDDACMSYLCSAEYRRGRMIDINALDPEIGIPWGDADPFVMSEKDARAPLLGQAADAGLLPEYGQCRDLYERLAEGPRAGHPAAD
ncbi:dTDP-4-dehydrorhamnose 3,5-epimerase family protein [Streptomyces sp. NPDC050560]|uniref:dTDP-4-dehydrorhamnose 3,5-epimerase family protein n=1 Tax=Streptomyces sp. NPDC050560 TaxID=3365630 RepID=UPI00379D30D7